MEQATKSDPWQNREISTPSKTKLSSNNKADSSKDDEKAQLHPTRHGFHLYFENQKTRLVKENPDCKEEDILRIAAKEWNTKLTSKEHNVWNKQASSVDKKATESSESVKRIRQIENDETHLKGLPQLKANMQVITHTYAVQTMNLFHKRRQIARGLAFVYLLVRILVFSSAMSY